MPPAPYIATPHDESGVDRPRIRHRRHAEEIIGAVVRSRRDRSENARRGRRVVAARGREQRQIEVELLADVHQAGRVVAERQRVAPFGDAGAARRLVRRADAFQEIAVGGVRHAHAQRRQSDRARGGQQHASRRNRHVVSPSSSRRPKRIGAAPTFVRTSPCHRPDGAIP